MEDTEEMPGFRGSEVEWKEDPPVIQQRQLRADLDWRDGGQTWKPMRSKLLFSVDSGGEHGRESGQEN